MGGRGDEKKVRGIERGKIRVYYWGKIYFQ